MAKKKSDKNKIVAKDARGIAYQVLCRVEDGAYADLTLDGALQALPQLDPRERALATELVYGVLRRRGNLDFILAAYCKQPVAKLEMAALSVLRIGVYQLFYLDKIPQRAAVHSSVELARQMGLERVTGLVNGILRSVIRDPQRVKWPDFEHDPVGWLTHCGSLPDWLAQRWFNELGAANAHAMAEAMLQPPPVTVRVNTLKITRDEFMQKLQHDDIACHATSFADEGVTVENGGRLRALPEEDGALYQVQDEASMLIAHLLQAQSGDKILDVCAAPGGKTTHIAALTANKAEIVAMDLHAKRLTLLQQGAQRLGCASTITTKEYDMSVACNECDAACFDRVLVDAPCSGLGVLRRNPDSRWRRTANDVKRLAQLQSAILTNAAKFVKPGGLLLYSVCTTTVEESQQVVDNFLRQHVNFSREDLRIGVADKWQGLFDERGQLTTFTPSHGGMDCFFAAALRCK